MRRKALFIGAFFTEKTKNNTGNSREFDQSSAPHQNSED
jgi:hypothetical protein